MIDMPCGCVYCDNNIRCEVFRGCFGGRIPSLEELVLSNLNLHERRPSECPLVEIKTPHGGLIDADKQLLEYAASLWPQSMDYSRAVALAEEFLKSAPRVIEEER